MSHAPECAGKVYGCPKCGQDGMTIAESHEHAETCKGDPDYNWQPDATFRMRHGLKVTIPVLNRHGDLKCPACGHDDISLWADDGEADLADWWDCQTSMGGCGAEGALVQAKAINLTQNGCTVEASS